MLRNAIGLVAVLAILSSCNPEVQLTGEFEEQAIVYAILDSADNPNRGGDGHLFRIQKAFLGEESAFIMAQNPDSSYFLYEDLFVELVEYNETNETNRWVLDTVMIADKDTGNPDDDVIDFFGPTQRLYKTATTGSDIVNINVDREYEITLKKRPAAVGTMTIASMDTVTPIADSRIEIVNPGSIRFTNPNENAAFNGTPQRMSLVTNTGEFVPYVVRFSTAQRARSYEIWFRFHYREVLNGNEELKTLEWRAATLEVGPDATNIQQEILAQDIYARIASELEPISGVIRKIGKADGSSDDPKPNDGRTQDFDVFVKVGGEALTDYISINAPSNSGVLQDKPVYTNINNGLGVFSSRGKIEFNDKMYLSQESATELVGGETTGDLGFIISLN